MLVTLGGCVIRHRLSVLF